MADIAKINGIQIGNVAKINGIDIGNVAKINGTTVNLVTFEDLTTFTEVDSDGDITITADSCAYDTMRRDAVSYVYKDYGAGYFGDFSIDFEFAISAQSLANNMIFGLSNTIGTLTDHDTANDGLTILGYHSGSSIGVYLVDYPTANNDSYTTAGSAIGPIYATFVRSGTTATFYIYSDSNRSVLVDTLTVTCSNTTYRYLYVLASLNSGIDPAQWITGYASHVAL